MAKTETQVKNLKINQGTYADILTNLSSIGENELIITDDKNIPIPTSNDNGKVVGVVDGDFSLVNPTPTGVTSLGGVTGAITLGSGLTMTGNELSATGGGAGISQSEVINRPNSLPTASASSPDFVQVSGVLYQKKVTQEVPSTVTDLTGTTWVFDDNISTSNFTDMSKSINFTSNSNNYTLFRTFAYDGEPDQYYIMYNITDIYGNENYGDPITWTNSAFKTIEIVDGTDVEDAILISFLQANATLQTAVTVYSYEEVGGGSSTTIVDWSLEVSE